MRGRPIRVGVGKPVRIIPRVGVAPRAREVSGIVVSVGGAVYRGRRVRVGVTGICVGVVSHIAFVGEIAEKIHRVRRQNFRIGGGIKRSVHPDESVVGERSNGENTDWHGSGFVEEDVDGGFGRGEFFRCLSERK